MRLLLIARPKDGDALNVKGVIALKRGRHDAAIDAFKRAVAVQPRNPGVHFNLGNAYLRANELEAAVEHYEAATRLRGGYADAEALKGDALRKLGRWPEASVAYRSVLEVKSDHFVALNGLGLCLVQEGDPAGAVEMLSAALAGLTAGDTSNRANVLANLGSARLQIGDGIEGLSALFEAASLLPDNNEIALLLARSLRHVRAVPEGEAVAAVLTRLLARNDINPSDLASAAICVLKSGHGERASLQPLWESPDGARDEGALDTLASDELIALLLKRTPVPDQEIELALTRVRRHLLLSASNASRGDHLAFVSALAQQCYLNEYVYSVSPEEEVALASLTKTLSTAMETDWSALAVLASYLPLGRLEPVPSDRGGAPSCIAELFKQQIDEPAEERSLAASVESLTAVSDAVSKAVQTQYEENPYPRWTAIARRAPRPFRQAIRERLPHLPEGKLPLTDDPRVLVAGCGTGLETMRVAGSYRSASILAIDLSRASLAYGMRKLSEYGVSGVEHKQADILELGQLDRRFDLIDSFGVIHHMQDPRRGLEILSHLLDPGGYLYVGLYSAIARKPVTRVRALIKAQGIPPTPAGMRALRRQIMLGEADPELSILASPASDFWSMSECRDLMFHVEEHHFTLLEIEEMLAGAGLEFVGLQVPYAPDLARFREENPDPSALVSLKAWHRFEESHPRTFGGTYQIWARKPA